MNDNVAKNIFISFLIVICLVALHIHQQLFLSWDVGALLLSTQRFLEGGNYLNDFFIANPPMIMYLYTPPVLLAKLCHISVTVTFPIYIFGLAVIAFLLCYPLVMRIFLKKDFLQAYIFLCALAVIFLIVPMYEFGQRDHLLVVMTMPYLLASVCRLQDKSVPRYFAIILGLFAGIGIAIKPQFIVLPALIETYYLFYKRSWCAWIKPETLAILGVLVLYTLFVLATRQDYIKVILPYLIKNYYGTSLVSYHMFLLNSLLLFLYASIVFYFFMNGMNEYKHLGTVLFIALVSFLSTYLLQGFMYFYHIVPALSLAILMLVQQYMNIVEKPKLTAANYRMLAIPILGMLLLLSFFLNIRFSLLLMDSALFFILFTLLFLSLFLLYKIKHNLRLKVGIVLFYLLACSILLNLTPESMQVLVLQFLIMLSMFYLFFSAIFKKPASAMQQHIFIASLGILLFFTPVWIEIAAYDVGVQYKLTTLHRLIAFARTLPPHSSIYTFSPDIHYTFPMVNYTDTLVAQRFDALWMIRAYMKKMKYQHEAEIIEEIRNNKSPMFVLNLIIEDFNKNKPDYVIIETKYPNSTDIIHYPTFPFLKYFSENKNFRDIWKNYHYFTTIDQPGEYRLDIYKLN